MKEPRHAPLRRARARKLRARRQALQASLGRRRQAARDALERRRQALAGARPKRRRRRWWLVVVALLLLLLLLLRDCSCTEPQLEPECPAPAVGPPAIPEAEAPAAPPVVPLPSGRVDRRARPRFVTEPLDPLPWLASYRLQVSARSLRLAQCFVGAPRPGTLRWTASVEPSQGQVSDQALEPTLLSDELTQQQRSCVFDVLSDPPYQLDAGQERSTPVRVGMVIEF